MWDQDNKNCSVIGEDLVVQGDISCNSDLMIEGQVEGNISCVSLFVGKSGNVTGDITTDDLLVAGNVHGKIQSDSVELKEGCTLEGDISSQTLAMDHGAIFTGYALPVKKNASPPGLKEAAE